MDIAFDDIYKNRKWEYADNETLSGGGSTKAINVIRNTFLSDFINENNILNVYDICGDCNWQYDFMKLTDISKTKYFGMDVSDYALTIAKHNNKLYNNVMKFSNKNVNLCNDKLLCDNGNQSLIIIKEVIQHLPLDDGIKMLKNIKKSKIKYIAITSHDIHLFDVTHNINVEIGGFYPNNIFLPPFNFKNPLKDVNNMIENDSDKKAYGNLIIFNIQEQNL
jgi:hypothetical protein